MEDLEASESDRVGQIENISIDGNTKFDKNQTFQSDSEIVINYHTYAKCSVNIHVNFAPNLIFSRYDVEFNFDNVIKEHFHMERMKITILMLNREIIWYNLLVKNHLQ